MKTSDYRRHIPIGVKLHAALLALGFTEDEINGGIQWDHDPPLALRFIDPETGQMIPAANDPRHIAPKRTSEHKTKTFGTRATTAGSDIHAIAKVRRLVKDPPGGEEFRRRLLYREDSSEPERKSRPKRKWAKRPFRRKLSDK